MKTFLKIITPLILILVIILISYNTYQATKQNNSNPITFIPKNSALIFKCNNPVNLLIDLEKTDIWKKLKSIAIVEIIDNNISEISTFLEGKENVFQNYPLYISIHKTGIHQNDILYSSNFIYKESNTLERGQI